MTRLTRTVLLMACALLLHRVQAPEPTAAAAAEPDLFGTHVAAAQKYGAAMKFDKACAEWRPAAALQRAPVGLHLRPKAAAKDHAHANHMPNAQFGNRFCLCRKSRLEVYDASPILLVKQQSERECRDQPWSREANAIATSKCFNLHGSRFPTYSFHRCSQENA